MIAPAVPERSSLRVVPESLRKNNFISEYRLRSGRPNPCILRRERSISVSVAFFVSRSVRNSAIPESVEGRPIVGVTSARPRFTSKPRTKNSVVFFAVDDDVVGSCRRCRWQLRCNTTLLAADPSPCNRCRAEAEAVKHSYRLLSSFTNKRRFDNRMMVDNRIGVCCRNPVVGSMNSQTSIAVRFSLETYSSSIRSLGTPSASIALPMNFEKSGCYCHLRISPG